MSAPPAPPLSISPTQRQALAVLARAQSVQHRQVTRARALLLAGDGVANSHIAAEVGVSVVTVRAWRERFAAEGLAELGRVRKGRGPKPLIPDETVRAIVEATLKTTPPGATHWSTRTMAAEFGVSASSVQRIWHDLDIKPHRVDTFKVSNDPLFEEAHRCGRAVSEPARERDRVVHGREEPGAGIGSHPALAADDPWSGGDHDP
jgi:transposase